MITQEAEKIVTEKSNDELLAMLAHPDDWRPDVLDAARAQLRTRGVEVSAVVPQTRDQGSPMSFSRKPRRGLVFLLLFVLLAVLPVLEIILCSMAKAPNAEVAARIAFFRAYAVRMVFIMPIPFFPLLVSGLHHWMRASHPVWLWLDPRVKRRPVIASICLVLSSLLLGGAFQAGRIASSVASFVFSFLLFVTAVQFYIGRPGIQRH